MSFGFSTGDFLAIIELATKVRKDFAGAPGQFKDFSDEVRSLVIVIQDVDIFLTCQEMTESDQKDLHAIIDRCKGVLLDAQRMLDKYSTLESRTGGIRGKAQRAWKQLTWEPVEIRDLRMRISSNITMLNGFSSKVIRDKVISLVEGQDRLAKRQEQQHHEEVLEWLTSIDYATQQSDLISRRQAGTGQWLLQTRQYRDWIAKEKEALFCPGIPGAGKTILASIVVDHLCDEFRTNDSIGICYIYFNYRHTDRQTLNDLMASLVKQLAHGQSSPNTIVRTLYDRHKDRKTRPSVAELRDTLHLVAREYSRLFVVVDALDECQTSDGCQSDFISELLGLQTTVEANVLTTSRFIPEVAVRFADTVQIEIRASDGDIGRYLDGNMSHLPRFVIDESGLQTEIKEEIMKSVDGMFLLAQLHLHSLRGKRSRKAVRNALRQLVKGSGAYDAAYNEAMGRVNSQLSDLKELGLQVLSWITCAKRPLTVAELQHALGVEFGQSYLDNENLPDVGDMVSSCCGLVTIDEHSRIIRLVHHTTQEYFERFKLTWFPEAQIEITRICATYMSFDVFHDDAGLHYSKDGKYLLLYPLLDYASRFWLFHVEQALIYDKSRDMIMGYLCSERALTTTYHALQRGTFRGRAPKGIVAMHLVAHFGLQGLMIQLKAAGTDLDASDENGETPLLWAARNQQEDMMRLLAEQGAKINTLDFERKTSLHHAAKINSLTMLKTLLRKGAVLTQDVDNMTPLHYAVLSGWKTGITALLDAGVAVDLSIRRVQFVQAYNNDRMVFERFDGVQQPVPHLSGASGPGLTPLHLATLIGHSEMVQFLLRHGADPAAKSNYGETPLHLCVGARIADEQMGDIWAEGSQRIESLFDILDMSDEKEWDDMHQLIRKERLAIISQLLASPATQVDAQDMNGSSCLHMIDYSGNRFSQEIANLLLTIGDAAVDLRDRNGMSPLHLACQKGDADSVRTFLDHGACTKLQDNGGCNALHHAAGSSNDKTLNAILNHTQDQDRSVVAVRDAEGRNVLHHLLSWLPSMEALKCLLT
ncbi:hypothetical protein PG987_003102 [Apiospora arundinis]